LVVENRFSVVATVVENWCFFALIGFLSM
jgi:hypothetical protein